MSDNHVFVNTAEPFSGLNRRELFGAAAVLVCKIPGAAGPPLALGRRAAEALLGMDSGGHYSAFHLFLNKTVRKIVWLDNEKTETGLFFYVEDNFEGFVQGLAWFFSILAADRRIVMEEARKVFAQAGKNDSFRFTDPALFDKPGLLWQLFLEEWDALKKLPADQVAYLEANGEKVGSLISRGRKWPVLALHPDKSDFESKCTPPPWWNGLGEPDRLKVWLEAICAAYSRVPLGLFFEGDKLLDILRHNLDYVKENGVVQHMRISYDRFLERFGEKGAAKQFLQTRRYIARLEGLSPAQAKERAKRELEEEQTPPCFLLERDSRITAPLMTFYVAKITAGDPGRNIYFQVYRLLAEEVFAGKADSLPEVGSTMRCQGDRIYLSVPSHGEARRKLDLLCTFCFGMTRDELNRNGLGLGEDLPRFSHELAEDGSIRSYAPESWPEILRSHWESARYHL